MAYTVKITMQQRIGLDSILSQQSGTIENLQAFYDLRRKLKAPAEVRDLYLVHRPNGTFWNEKQVTLAETFEFEIENEELRRVEKLLETWPHISTDDLDWILPLKATLREAQNPGKKPRPAKTA